MSAMLSIPRLFISMGNACSCGASCAKSWSATLFWTGSGEPSSLDSERLGPSRRTERPASREIGCNGDPQPARVLQRNRYTDEQLGQTLLSDRSQSRLKGDSTPKSKKMLKSMHTMRTLARPGPRPICTVACRTPAIFQRYCRLGALSTYMVACPAPANLA